MLWCTEFLNHNHFSNRNYSCQLLTNNSSYPFVRTSSEHGGRVYIFCLEASQQFSKASQIWFFNLSVSTQESAREMLTGTVLSLERYHKNTKTWSKDQGSTSVPPTTSCVTLGKYIVTLCQVSILLKPGGQWACKALYSSNNYNSAITNDANVRLYIMVAQSERYLGIGPMDSDTANTASII